MFRFTIRELLILTVTAGLAVGWWVDHRQMNERHKRMNERLRFLELATEFIPGTKDVHQKPRSTF